ncbi:MAG: beta-galactosidase [Candidatus Doudnabacteria bacterium]|nr:beta-galactosidase [Candidatus Doudnabacteria bacterium]
MKKILLAILIVAALASFFYLRFEPAKDIQWGLNFSIHQAGYLGLDWKETYLYILDDLKPKYLRLMAYWEILEPDPGQFSFADFNYQLEEAHKRGIKVILVLGSKQPRWPECHHPAWYAALDTQEKEEAVLQMLRAAVEHFRDFGAIKAWQVENEPFFPYGPECPAISRELLRQEISLVKNLDLRPVIVTDSGEKGAWLPAAWVGADVFGSTMYRQVYHDKKMKYIKYPIPAALYRIKAGMVQTLSPIREFVGIELQAEPWFATNVYQTDWEDQKRLMNPEIFAEYIDYARRAGFAENYLWGVEWWYWARQQGHLEMWEAGKSVINNP